MPLLIFVYACSISRCAHLLEAYLDLLEYCFHVNRNSSKDYLRAFAHLFKSARLKWQLTHGFVFPSREHQMMPYPVEELGCIPPLEVQMVSESMPACAADFWQSLWLTVLLAHFSFCASVTFDGYLPVFRQCDGIQCTELKLSSKLHHHCWVWFQKKMPSSQKSVDAKKFQCTT